MLNVLCIRLYNACVEVWRGKSNELRHADTCFGGVCVCLYINPKY